MFSICPLKSQEISTDSLFKLAKLNFSPDLKLTNYYLNAIISKASFEKDTISIYKALELKGNCALYYNQVDSIYFNLKKAERLLNTASIFYKNDSLKISNNHSIGSYLYKIGDFNHANKYFEENIKLFQNKKVWTQSDTANLINTYQYLYTDAERKGNHDKALRYIQNEILTVIQQYGNENHQSVKESICNLAAFQTRIHLCEAAMANFENCIPDLMNKFSADKAFPERAENLLCQFYELRGKCYLELNNLDSAIILLNKSLLFSKAQKNIIANSELSLGLAYGKNNLDEKAATYFKSSLQKLHALYKSKHLQIAKTYATIGEFYLNKNKTEIALKNFQLALQQHVLSFDKSDFVASPDAADLFVDEDLIKTLRLKTTALNQIATEQNSSELKYIAFETGRKCIQLMKKAMAEQTRNEKDVIGIVNRNYGLFEEVLSIGFDLGMDANDNIFGILESSKSASLLKLFKHKNDLNFAEIPPDISNEYYLLKHQIVTLEKLIHTRISEQNTNKIELATLRNKLFKMQEELVVLETKINLLLPKQSNDNNIALAKIQSKLLTSKEAILEYFIGKENAFVFLIKKDQVHFEKLNLTKEDLLAAGNLKEKISYGQPADFVSDAKRLYDVLLKPLKEKHGLTKKLIIIPDGPLYYLPFEVLLTGPIDNPKEFGEFPYLIQDHDISYCFSSTMLDNLENKKHVATPKSEVLSFAPSFTHTASSGRSIADVRGELNDLDYNKKEIDFIKNWLYSHALVDTVANKENFMKFAGDYRFIHLATHAKVDDKNPDYSYIAFTNGADTIPISSEDFKLFSNELSNLNLKADMVVLSACESGVGKVFKGEGIISISRGFIEAGAKSIVTTLWNINDELSADLMNRFYKHLSQAYVSKDNALCLAKKEYLQKHSAHEAHPKYWAAFVPYGDMSPVSKISFASIWYGGVGMMLMLLMFYYRRFFIVGKRDGIDFPPCPCLGVWCWN